MPADLRVGLFSRYPVPGKAKTRLIPEVGDAGAAYCQVVMTEKVIREAVKLKEEGVGLDVWYVGGDEGKMTWWVERMGGVRLKEQVEGGLGVKIAKAFESAFDEGAKRAIIVGADIPHVTAETLRNAFTELATTQMVIQQALDGGYILIGLNATPASTLASLFITPTPSIPWGTETVFAQQIQAATNLGISFKVIGDPMSDVDTAEELPVFEDATSVTIRALRNPLIGIVTPVINEAENIRSRVPRWIEAAAHRGSIAITICDGGSTDNLTEIVEQLQTEYSTVPIKMVESGKGRGLQISTGVNATDCDIVLMVHADTILPERYDETLVGIVRTPGVAAGAFRLGLDVSDFRLNLVVKGANLRSVYREIPYGDQAIFVARHVLDQVGGIRKDYPLLEDLELVTRLKAHGHIVTSHQSVTTSSRRWLRHGVFKITAVNQLVLIAYDLGVPPATLATWYYKGGPLWWLPFAIVLSTVVVTLANLL
eukprot:TRINITY_DN16909_c0_g4_i1.p1 TRINITY_DN16909_c0_g4~~TRINITY_DN16909_c0_g4_i1.p1  ORF type:complete len:497 (+),score=123.94 TRINITY_DN16909_c0_g4_i1:43-1491(+)